MKYILEILFLIMVFYLLVLASGCAVLTKPAVDKLPEVYNSGRELVKVVRSTNWLATVCILGATLSVFAALNGIKWGYGGIVACFAGLTMTFMAAKYAAWLAGFGLFGSVILCIASVLLKNNALKEIIKGVQRIKAMSTIDTKEAQNGMLAEVQTKPTKKLVQKTKMDMKLKGIIA